MIVQPVHQGKCLLIISQGGLRFAEFSVGGADVRKGYRFSSAILGLAPDRQRLQGIIQGLLKFAETKINSRDV